MVCTELASLFQDLREADLDRALRLIGKAFQVQSAGLIFFKPDGQFLFHKVSPAQELGAERRLILEKFSVDQEPGQVEFLDKSQTVVAVCFLGPAQTRGVMYLEKLNGWEAHPLGFVSAVAWYLAKLDCLAGELASDVDRARLEQRLADSALFAGRAAHDLNNLFTGIKGFAELSLPHLPVESPLHENLREIHAAAERGFVFTQQFQAFSRSGVLRNQPSHVRSVFERILKKREEQPLTVHLAAELPAVALEDNALQLVIDCLLDNALQSKRGAKVQLKVELKQLTQEDCLGFQCPPNPGSHVQIQITDDGPGIREDIYPKVALEPFLTTKPRHRGLGLMICYRILRTHNAGLRLDSVPGRGTTAYVVVPISAVRTRNTSVESRAIAHSTGG